MCVRVDLVAEEKGDAIVDEHFFLPIIIVSWSADGLINDNVVTSHDLAILNQTEMTTGIIYLSSETVWFIFCLCAARCAPMFVCKNLNKSWDDLQIYTIHDQ